MQVRPQMQVCAATRRWPVPEGERLERAMVAGLMLEVVLDEPPVPTDPEIRRRQIKSRLTYTLVKHLAGRITLDRFRALMHHLEQWFPFYYPLMPPPPLPEEQQLRLERSTQSPAAGRPHPLLRLEVLKDWLQNHTGAILPRRPQRKIHPEGLEAFFQLTQGGWFRGKDFAQYFDIDRKTAWEYLQKLKDAGMLAHNGGRSAAVRHRLADHFLKVKLTDLERRVTQALAWLPRPQAGQVSDWLAATGGEPFWEKRWPERLTAGHREEIFAALKEAALLEVVYQTGERRMLRLPRRWLWLYEDQDSTRVGPQSF